MEEFYFDGEYFSEVRIPVSIGMITHIEQIWGKVYYAIPKHIRNPIEARFKRLYEMTEDEARGFLHELYPYLPNEYPINGTVAQQTRWMRNNIF